ncbi:MULTISPECIES: DNA-binding protein WhiA [Clavibacter]|uniref:Probable cell division protein WhiA n=8 Tax=Clavibacter TaxID=1573 RepID=WHIA_CLAM3|nr:MULTISPECIES: DNA-binding protein WhiA [Clavibacter]A5CRT9.1 RecName: Full=Probable cell division protein WhiA [Clavibacter michiganensis subsp. michiganensis NCPPB 382]AJW79075.1 sporulation protein [Clavibacter michiganensis subsp. insidiosus]KAF0259959.1 putative sporulation transcription regulator WhiA [Clavibacter michiganensis subsp. michiganensis]KDP90063.1 sporulation protein [Clavibacter cf. michiganensis LMG 26808]MBE3076961.1 DNA-binding protein WhiA [Clavibacter michiganensis su
MPLTSDVKEELSRVEVSKTTVRAAELATILRFSGGLHLISNRIAVESELDTPLLARRVRKDLAELYGVRSDISVIPASGMRRATHYLVRVMEGGETLARQTGLLDARRRPIRGLPNRLTTGSREEIAAVWRGAFLAAGTLTDPGRSAALEVTCPGNEAAMALVGAAGRLDVSAKAREVRGVHRVVIRDGDAIGQMLRVMGAQGTVVNWEEMRQRREVRATANRLVNFDDANLRRSAQAAVAACARVERAMEILGPDIPEHLKYAGDLRLRFRDSSLDELGHHADPPMTKDAVAGRIRRLLAMADKKAVDEGLPGTDANLPADLDDV